MPAKHFDGIRLRNAAQSLGKKTSERAQPRRSVASGYVSAVQTDASGKIVTATVQVPGSGSVRAQVPYGANVYTSMGVQIENYGSPSNASWAIAGTTYLPTGSTGGVVINQNGNIIAMFEAIWIRDDGYLLVGGVEDPDGNPTGPRVLLTDTGIFGWDAYDTQNLAIYTQDVGGASSHLAGDVMFGYEDGGRIEMSAQERSFGIWNDEEVVMLFSPGSGNRITGALWVGDEPGPQVGIGKLDDTSFIAARDYGTGTMNEIGDEVKFLVSAHPDKVTFHVGDPDHTSSYIFYDSSVASGAGELTVDAILRAREIEIFGPGLIAEGGYIGAEAAYPSLAGIWLRPKYLEGRGNAGDRTFLLTAAAVTLDRHPYDPTYGAITWSGGEGYIGDVLFRHLRFDGRGAEGHIGLYNGEDPKVYFDFMGNAILDGTVYAWNREVIIGREGRGVEIPLVSGSPDEARALVAFISDIQTSIFRAGIWTTTYAFHDDEMDRDNETVSMTIGVQPAPPYPGTNSYLAVRSYAEADKEGWLRLQALGDDGNAPTATIDMYSYRGGDTTPIWNHSRIIFNSGVVQLTANNTAPAVSGAGSMATGMIAMPDNSGWVPHSYIGGRALMAYMSGAWTPFAQAWGTTHRFGAATANYVEIAGDGSMTFTGDAKLFPRYKLFSKTGSFTADQTEALSYRCNTSTGNATATLPAAGTTNSGIRFKFRKVSGDANTLTVSTVNGGDIVLTAQWQYCEVESNGSTWERSG